MHSGEPPIELTPANNAPRLVDLLDSSYISSAAEPMCPQGLKPASSSLTDKISFLACLSSTEDEASISTVHLYIRGNADGVEGYRYQSERNAALPLAQRDVSFDSPIQSSY